MKIARVLAVALVGFATLPMLAQQAGATAQQSDSAAAAGAGLSVTAHAEDSTTAAAAMHPVSGVLAGKLDSRFAKAGDLVVVKTTEPVKTADGATIPRGSRLVGEVTSVQAQGAGSAGSHLAIKFYRAELKGGQAIAIHSEIESVSRPAGALEAGSMDADSFGEIGGMGNGTRGMGDARVAGGMAGVSRLNVASTTSRTTERLGGAAEGTATRIGSQTASTTGRIHAGQIAVTHSTGIPGVMLRGRDSLHGSASGTLSASQKNIHLDNGTQMVLGVSELQ